MRFGKGKKESNNKAAGVLKRVFSPMGSILSARLLALMSLFLLMMLLNLATALAYVQSHNLSEVRNIDTNLDMYQKNITNVTRMGIGTTNPLSTLSVGGSGNVNYKATITYDGSNQAFLASNQIGVNGWGSNYGVYGYGPYGVFGHGVTTGVFGEGNNYGVWGNGTGYGVYGTGNPGVYAAFVGDTNRYAFMGDQNYGIYAQSNTAGGYFKNTDTFGAGLLGEAAVDNLALNGTTYNVGLYGEAASAGGNSHGVVGLGRDGGVRGCDSDFDCDQYYGLLGVTTTGVYGYGATGVAGYGTTYGVYGERSGNYGYLGGNNYGLYAYGTNVGVVGMRAGAGTVNASYGVYGTGNVGGILGEYSDTRYGYLGDVNYGVYGTYDGGTNFGYLGGSDRGVYGKGSTYGVYGLFSANTYGVLGESLRGVRGVSNDAGGYGVHGTGLKYGIYGQTTDGNHWGILGTTTYGVQAYSSDGIAVHGNSGGGISGVYGTGSVAGVIGNISGSGSVVSGTGVYGTGSSYGVYGQGPLAAGYFNGNVTVTGNMTVGTGTIFLDGTNSLVGIDTTSPQAELHVNDGDAAGVALRLTDQPSGATLNDGFSMVLSSGNSQLWNAESGYLRFATNNDEKMRLHASGGLAFGNSYDTTDPGADNVIIEGLVGIGTVAPAAQLHVNFSGGAGGAAIIANSTGQGVYTYGDKVGVYGTGDGWGLIGSGGGFGVFGEVKTTVSPHHGVGGSAFGATNNIGVFGNATLTNNNIGVYGTVDPTPSYPWGDFGMVAEYNDSNIVYLGGYGSGVVAYASGTSSNRAVVGVAYDTGVSNNYGVFGSVDGSFSYPSGDYGVYGMYNESNFGYLGSVGYGGYAEATSSSGTMSVILAGGDGLDSIQAVSGASSSYGVYSRCTGSNCYAFRASATGSGTSYGIRASGTAGAIYATGNCFDGDGPSACSLNDIAEEWQSEKSLEYWSCTTDRTGERDCSLPEWFEKEFSDGDVVCALEGKVNVLRACNGAYDKSAIAVISETPTIVLGGVGPYNVALAGNVPVKVLCDAPIEVGDLLVYSGTENYAMKLGVGPDDTVESYHNKQQGVFAKALEPCESGNRTIRAWI